MRPDLPDGQRLGHDVADPAPGVERRDGVLEDHLDLRAQRAQVAAVERGQLGVAEADLARGGLLHLHDGAPGRRLAAAGLPDEAEGLALAHGELMPATACTVVLPLWKETCRSSTESSGSVDRGRCPSRRHRLARSAVVRGNQQA